MILFSLKCVKLLQKKSESFDIPDKFAFLRLTYPHLLRIFVAILSAIKMITFVAPISQRFTRFVQVFLPYFCYLSILSNAQQSLLWGNNLTDRVNLQNTYESLIFYVLYLCIMASIKALTDVFQLNLNK